MELLESSDKLEAFRRGDRAVLDAVYRCYVDDVEGMLRAGFTFTSQGETVRFRGMSEPFRLQEAIQTSFLKAFRQSARQAYDGSRAFGPYLLTIVRNAVIDDYRKRRRQSAMFVHLGDMAFDDEHDQDALDRVGGGGEGEQTSPESETWKKQLAEVLSDFVDGLGEVDRRVLDDYLVGDFTQHEMAKALDMSRNDVRKHIRQMRSRLLRHLKRHDIIGALDVDEVMDAVSTFVVLVIFGALR